jgi:hypothetical protein
MRSCGWNSRPTGSISAARRVVLLVVDEPVSATHADRRSVE